MKKYTRAICIIYTYIRFCLIKLLHFKTFNFTFLNIVSPFTQIEIGRGAKLILGSSFKVRSGSKLRVRKGALLKIGEASSINYNCIITAHKNITIGNDVQIGPNVLIYDHDHDYKKINGLKNLDYNTGDVEIGDNTWIGANVVILRGTTIGANSVIAAGTIVKGDIPSGSLVYNNKQLNYKSIKDMG